MTADPKVSPWWKGRLPISGTYREEWGLLEDADGTYLCEVQNVSGKLFSHIVRCVNAHDGLVEALATLIANAELIGDPRMYSTADCYAVPLDDIEAARAALAAAKEGA